MLEILDTLIGIPTFTDTFYSDLYNLIRYMLGTIAIIVVIFQVLWFFYYIVKPMKGGR